MSRGGTVVLGQRRCTVCGYRLRGQPIITDDRYGLLLVRCPECGASASADCMPLLGRWARLWTTVLAVTWCVVVAGGWMAGGLAQWGLCLATAQVSAQSYRGQLDRKFLADTGADGGVAAALPPSQAVIIGGVTGQGMPFEKWWAQQDPDTLLADAGGRWAAINWWALLLWLPLGLISLVLGCAAAVVLSRLDCWKLLLAAPLVGSAALVLALMSLLTWRVESIMWSNEAALQQVGVPILVVSVGAALLLLAAGMVAGRPAARLLLRATVPRRLRKGFALLWLVDGKEAPV